MILVTAVILSIHHNEAAASLFRMTNYEHITHQHDITKRILIDCLGDLDEVKTELSTVREELSSVRTELLNNTLQSEKKDEELQDTKQRLCRANTLIRQSAIRTSPFGTESSSPF